MAKPRVRRPADDGLIRFPELVSARLRAIEQAKIEAIQQTAIRFAQMQLEYIRGYCDANGIDIEQMQLELLPDMSGARRGPRPPQSRPSISPQAQVRL